MRENLATLRARGVHVVDPGDGYLACGWVGAGRLAEPETDCRGRRRACSARGRSLAGRRVLVTAGPTVEDLDAVRFIGNRSSGRMGFAIAAEAHARGAHVVLVAGPDRDRRRPPWREVVRVRSAREMHAAVHARAADASTSSSWPRPWPTTRRRVAPSPGRSRRAGRSRSTLERTPTSWRTSGARRGDRGQPVLVGFAAQAGDPVAAARRKLDDQARRPHRRQRRHARPAAGFDVDTNQVTLVTRDGAEPLPLQSKADVARADPRSRRAAARAGRGRARRLRDDRPRADLAAPPARSTGRWVSTASRAIRRGANARPASPVDGRGVQAAPRRRSAVEPTPQSAAAAASGARRCRRASDDAGAALARPARGDWRLHAVCAAHARAHAGRVRRRQSERAI